MTNNKNDALKPIERAMIAYKTEQSAQVGEPYYREYFDEFKGSGSEEFDEQLTCLQCAVDEYNAALTNAEPQLTVATIDDLEIIRKFIDGDTDTLERFLGALCACGFEIVKKLQPPKEGE